MSEAMVLRGEPATLAKAEPMAFSEEQERMIRDTFANGASAQEFAVLLEIAKVRRLNPLLRQIHFVKRWDRDKGREVWSTQVSIDGLRAIAERTGKYDGQDEPEFMERDGRIVGCKVRVYRKDWTRPAVGVAYWSEYVQTKKDGNPTQFWSRMPHVMIAKCAEALALRKAFPEDMSGLYTPEEMAQAENSRRAVQAEAAELASEPDLEKALSESVDANWPAWAASYVASIEATHTKGELLEVWASFQDDVKRLKPPAEYVEAVKLAKDQRKAAL
jgi:phage recombination protein Bet